MRTSTFILAGAVLLPCVLHADTPTPTRAERVSLAEIATHDVAGANQSIAGDPIAVNRGSDTIPTATVIPALPYWDTGTTESHQDDCQACSGCFS